MKKILAVLLTVLLLSALCAPAAGAEGIKELGKALLEQFSGSTASNNAETAQDEWENILLMGCDARGDSLRERTDSMVILSVNHANARIKMTSLMRDTWLKASGKEGNHKLTEFNVWGGPEMTMRAINENFGMELEKYALVNMKGLAEIVDIVDGVDVEISEAERKKINSSVSWNMSSGSTPNTLSDSGLVHLNGCQALAFARIRHLDNDYVRTERQRKVLLGLAKKIRGNFDLQTVPALIGTLWDYMETNLSMADIMRLAGTAMNADVETIEQYRVPVDGTFRSGMFGSVWCIKPDFAENAKLLHDFIYE